MASETTTGVLQGELERLFDLHTMTRLSTDMLGFDPEKIGSTDSKGAFARALVAYCKAQQALPALVDAILLSTEEAADAELRRALQQAPNAELSEGTQVGELRVVKKIGEGGLSVVYLAEGDGGRVALKVYRPQYALDRSAVHRFTTASRALRSIEAPGLVPVLGVGVLADARPWVAAEYLTGETMAVRIERAGGMHIDELKPICAGVLQGLAALHRRGLVHGDVKTENVFIVHPDDDAGTTSGVLVDAASDRLLTRTQLGAATTGLLPVLGTAKAIAPEQARGIEPDARTDVYQVGTLLYEALTGEPPFVGDSAIDVIAQHLSVAPQPPSSKARKGWISEALDELILRALAKDPADRFANAEALAEALDALTDRKVEKRPLDERAFEEARQALLSDPGDETATELLEQYAGESDVWDRAAGVMTEATRATEDPSLKIGLLFRAARVYETEVKDLQRAEASYQQVLELDPENEIAHRGIEHARRSTGDHEGVIEILLDRVERATDPDAQVALLGEVATLYEKQLGDPDNALVAWTQALLTNLKDERARKQVERIAGTNQNRWSEVLATMSEAAQHAQAALEADDDAPLQAAREELAQATAARDELRAAFEAQLDARRQEAEEARLQAAQQAEANKQEAEALAQDAQAAVEVAHAQLAEAEAQLSEAAQALETTSAAVAEAEEELEQVSGEAEQQVEAYEAAEAEAGEEPDEEQVAELEALGAEAERLVDLAGEAQTKVAQANQDAEEARAAMVAAQEAVDAAQQQLAELEQAVPVTDADLVEDVEDVEEADAAHEPLDFTADELAQLTASEAAVEDVERRIAQLEGSDEAEREAERQRNRTELVAIYVLMGRWYAERVHRADFSLPCFTQALTLDESNEAAYDGIADLYRASQAWTELATLLLERGQKAASPLRGRDYRAEAAAIIANKLNDQARARVELEAVLHDDPAHPIAQRELATILREHGDWVPLAELLERRVSTLPDAERVSTLLELAEIHEDQIGDVDKAAASFEAALAVEPREMAALKGLERIYARKGNFEGLLNNLRAQVDLAPTPKQRIGLLERIGLLLEEEFVDHAAAANVFEDIISIDAGNLGANVALIRLYRHLQRFEDVVEALDRSAGAADDDERKVDLWLQAARVLTSDIGSPDRAAQMYDRVLSVDGENIEALDEIARLKSTAGDLSAALEAVEMLAKKEADPAKKADLWVRAGKILDEGGDRDGAIDRYRRALDANRSAVAAAEALREIYVQRGDAHGASEMLLHAIETADGDLKRAQLLAELGVLYRDQLGNPDEAEVAFEEAFKLDPTSTAAAVGLGRLALERGEHRDALDFIEPVLARLNDLDATQAGHIWTQVADCYQQTEQPQRAVDALRSARDLMPDDMAAHQRYAEAVMARGDARQAERLYQAIHEQFVDRLDVGERVELAQRLADAQIGAERPHEAVTTAKQALDLRPEDPELLGVLTRAYEAAGQWDETITTLQLRTRRAATADERFDLLVKTGDVFLERLKDRDASVQTFVMALDLKPDSRNLLTKLMGVYSEAGDWPRLIEIILRIANMVDDDAQSAKYYTTAATIAQTELHRFDEAANYYEQALAKLPPNEGATQFDALVKCLNENQDWERLDQVYERQVARMQTAEADPTVIAALLHVRGELLHLKLGRAVEGIEQYERALELEPDNASRREMLAAIYTKEPKRFFQRAVAAHRFYLAEDPYRVESLRALRKIYTSAKKPDESWCLCQALRCMQMADMDEEKFYKKYRLARLPKVKNPIGEDAWWRLVVHPSQDPTVTSILVALQPAAVSAQAQKLAAFGIARGDQVDPSSESIAMGRMLDHASQTLGIPLPELYQNANDPGGLSFLFTLPPAIGIGMGALAGGPQQALAYVAARHLAYYRSGHYMRQLVPTGTGLRAWLLAAIRTVAPKFPVPPTMEVQIKECHQAIRTHLLGPHLDALRSVTQKLLEAAPELDMKSWIAGVDLTADRAGLILCNDLKVAQAVVDASPEDGATVSRRDRSRELLVYSVSDAYFEARSRMGIALGG